MYSVIGPDGKVYGPADPLLIRQWCQEGRITPDTKIVDPIDGLTKHAAEIPEIAQNIPVTRPPTQPNTFGIPYQQTPISQYNYSQPPSPYGYQNPLSYGPPRSKVLAILLAFFLGGLGIHRFYLGHTGTGLAMLLITVLTCGYGIVVTGIWAIVDIVLIATGDLQDANNRPLV